jgi:hypothetical protein
MNYQLLLNCNKVHRADQAANKKKLTRRHRTSTERRLSINNLLLTTVRMVGTNIMGKVESGQSVEAIVDEQQGNHS